MQIRNMRPGQIMLWYGVVADVPSGWHICNGQMNTPDLRNRFVVGAGDTYPPGDTGGQNAHGHNYSGPLHSHSVDVGTNVMSGSGFDNSCLLYTSPSPRDLSTSRMPSSA